MGVQFALTARFRWIAGRVGMDAMIQFHRQAGLVAFGFVLAHPVILILNSRRALAYFDPTVNLPRALSLSTAIICLILIVALSMRRQALRIPYEWWRLTHGVLAAMVLLIGLAHTLMVGRFVSEPWKQGMWILLIGVAVTLLVQTRILKPILSLRRPWRVQSVRRELERLWTVTLAADGHAGTSFAPGQCFWVTIAGSPFSLQQHPFTVASSARDGVRLEFTIKELGDFTSRIGEVKLGSRAWLEGPYGAFDVPSDPEAPLVMIAGGIGITPFLSIMRTLRDQGARRRGVLIYGAKDLESMAFRGELEECAAATGVALALLPEHPPPGWEGESGFLTPQMLGRLVEPQDEPSSQYFVCGPDPMMDLVESSLLERGVSLARLHSERFNIA
jgi:predicted ferric reductase